MGVDAHGDRKQARGFFGKAGDGIEKAAAVGVAEDNGVRSCVCRCLNAGECVIFVFCTPVKEVFRVKDDFPSAHFEVADGFLDHSQVFLRGNAQNGRYMQKGAFTKDRCCRSFRFQKGQEPVVRFRPDSGALGAAKCAKFRVLKRKRFCDAEKFQILWIRRRVPGFDVGNSQFIELADNLDFVFEAE